jgi:hypothetical protein
MQFHPEIRALLDHPERLRAQQAAHQSAWHDWRAAPAQRVLFDAFSAFAAGTALSALPALSALFDGSDRAAGLARGLTRAVLPVLADARFGQVPLRHSTSRVSTTVLLAREGLATLSLVALDGTGLALNPVAQSAAFSPAEEWDAVIAGAGEGRLVERSLIGGAHSVAVHPLRFAPGLALGRDAEREALLVDRAKGALLLLRLQRRRPGPTPVREFDLADGRQIHQSAASARDSRHEIAVALLGRMGRADAAPVLAELATDVDRADMLRWQALRECLALDTLAGFRALAALACRTGDPLAPAAGALRAQLIEQHPVLAEIEPCPA